MYTPEERLQKKRENHKRWYAKNKARVSEKARLARIAAPEKTRRLARESYHRTKINGKGLIRSRMADGIVNPTAERKTGPCDICGRIKKLAWDHSHVTGLFRGWLCFTCNTHLGWLERTYGSTMRYLGTGVAPTLTMLQQEAYNTAEVKGWHDKGKPPVPESCALIVSEVCEALTSHRNKEKTLWWHEDKPEGWGIEMADVVIRVAHFCQLHGIDLASMVGIKMKYNLTRPYRHGGKKY
jgi:NTP pyrophosphatase (non-canonical NTP hydrolase)